MNGHSYSAHSFQGSWGALDLKGVRSPLLPPFLLYGENGCSRMKGLGPKPFVGEGFFRGLKASAPSRCGARGAWVIEDEGPGPKGLSWRRGFSEA